MKNRKIAWILVIVLSLNMVGNDQAVLALGDTMEEDTPEDEIVVEEEKTVQQVVEVASLDAFMDAVNDLQQEEMQVVPQVITYEQNGAGEGENTAGEGVENTGESGQVTTTLIVMAPAEIKVEDPNARKVIRGYENMTVLQYETRECAQKAYERFAMTEGITGVEYNETIEKSGIEAEKAMDQIGLSEFLCAEENNELQIESKRDVILAILDTGIRADAAVGSHVIGKGINTSVEESMEDENGHGTWMAELVAAATSQSVQILPIKSMGKDGKGSVLSVYLGMEKACEAGAKVINLSLSSQGTSRVLEEAVQKAKEQGVIVVAAAGNNGRSAESYMPGNISEAVTISSVDAQGQLSSFANTGEVVDLVAPGEQYWTEDDTELKGTSFSTALVAAGIAELFSIGIEDPVEQLMAHARDLGESGRDAVYGNGMVDFTKIKAGKEDKEDTSEENTSDENKSEEDTKGEEQEDSEENKNPEEEEKGEEETEFTEEELNQVVEISDLLTEVQKGELTRDYVIQDLGSEVVQELGKSGIDTKQLNQIVEQKENGGTNTEVKALLTLDHDLDGAGHSITLITPDKENTTVFSIEGEDVTITNVEVINVAAQTVTTIKKECNDGWPVTEVSTSNYELKRGTVEYGCDAHSGFIFDHVDVFHWRTRSKTKYVPSGYWYFNTEGERKWKDTSYYTWTDWGPHEERRTHTYGAAYYAGLEGNSGSWSESVATGRMYGLSIQSGGTLTVRNCSISAVVDAIHLNGGSGDISNCTLRAGTGINSGCTAAGCGMNDIKSSNNTIIASNYGINALGNLASSNDKISAGNYGIYCGNNGHANHSATTALSVSNTEFSNCSQKALVLENHNVNGTVDRCKFASSVNVGIDNYWTTATISNCSFSCKGEAIYNRNQATVDVRSGNQFSNVKAMIYNVGAKVQVNGTINHNVGGTAVATSSLYGIYSEAGEVNLNAACTMKASGNSALGGIYSTGNTTVNVNQNLDLTGYGNGIYNDATTNLKNGTQELYKNGKGIYNGKKFYTEKGSRQLIYQNTSYGVHNNGTMELHSGLKTGFSEYTGMREGFKFASNQKSAIRNEAGKELKLCQDSRVSVYAKSENALSNAGNTRVESGANAIFIGGDTIVIHNSGTFRAKQETQDENVITIYAASPETSGIKNSGGTLQFGGIVDGTYVFKDTSRVRPEASNENHYLAKGIVNESAGSKDNILYETAVIKGCSTAGIKNCGTGSRLYSCGTIKQCLEYGIFNAEDTSNRVELGSGRTSNGRIYLCGQGICNKGTVVIEGTTLIGLSEYEGKMDYQNKSNTEYAINNCEGAVCKVNSSIKLYSEDQTSIRNAGTFTFAEESRSVILAPYAQKVISNSGILKTGAKTAKGEGGYSYPVSIFAASCEVGIYNSGVLQFSGILYGNYPITTDGHVEEADTSFQGMEKGIVNTAESEEAVFGGCIRNAACGIQNHGMITIKSGGSIYKCFDAGIKNEADGTLLLERCFIGISDYTSKKLFHRAACQEGIVNRGTATVSGCTRIYSGKNRAIYNTGKLADYTVLAGVQSMIFAAGTKAVISNENGASMKIQGMEEEKNALELYGKAETGIDNMGSLEFAGYITGAYSIGENGLTETADRSLRNFQVGIQNGEKGVTTLGKGAAISCTGTALENEGSFLMDSGYLYQNEVGILNHNNAEIKGGRIGFRDYSSITEYLGYENGIGIDNEGALSVTEGAGRLYSGDKVAICNRKDGNCTFESNANFAILATNAPAVIKNIGKMQVKEKAEKQTLTMFSGYDTTAVVNEGTLTGWGGSILGQYPVTSTARSEIAQDNTATFAIGIINKKGGTATLWGGTDIASCYDSGVVNEGEMTVTAGKIRDNGNGIKNLGTLLAKGSDSYVSGNATGIWNTGEAELQNIRVGFTKYQNLNDYVAGENYNTGLTNEGTMTISGALRLYEKGNYAIYNRKNLQILDGSDVYVLGIQAPIIVLNAKDAECKIGSSRDKHPSLVIAGNKITSTAIQNRGSLVFGGVIRGDHAIGRTGWGDVQEGRYGIVEGICQDRNTGRTEIIKDAQIKKCKTGIYNVGEVIQTDGTIEENSEHGIENVRDYTLKNGIVQNNGNETNKINGAGISNSGTLIQTGGKITGNRTKGHGNGIYQAGIYRISEDAKVEEDNDVYLTGGYMDGKEKYITVDGQLKQKKGYIAMIRISDERCDVGDVLVKVDYGDTLASDVLYYNKKDTDTKSSIAVGIEATNYRFAMVKGSKLLLLRPGDYIDNQAAEKTTENHQQYRVGNIKDTDIFLSESYIVDYDPNLREPDEVTRVSTEWPEYQLKYWCENLLLNNPVIYPIELEDKKTYEFNYWYDPVFDQNQKQLFLEDEFSTPQGERYPTGSYYKHNKATTLFGEWTTYFKIAYDGNTQTTGEDYTDAQQTNTKAYYDYDVTTFTKTEYRDVENPETGELEPAEILYSFEGWSFEDDTLMETGRENVIKEVTNFKGNYLLKRAFDNAGLTFIIPKYTDSQQNIKRVEEKDRDDNGGNKSLLDTIYDGNGLVSEEGGMREHKLDIVKDYQLVQDKKKVLKTNVNVMNSKIYANMYAVWDEYPQIRAEERYFSLEDALEGRITEERLLRTAYAKDKEDGNLTEKLTITDLDQERLKEFMHEGIFSITYEIKDSVGNVTDKVVKIHIVDTVDEEYEFVFYDTRFIDKEFFGKKYEEGGLYDNSYWRINHDYQEQLQKVLSNERVEMERANQEGPFSNNSIKIPGTGHFTDMSQESISLTNEEVQNIKDNLN